MKQARIHIKGLNIKKQGRNEFSKYDYYTPEQVNQLVNDAAEKFNLFNKFDLVRTELGMMARLQITDIDSGKSLTFEIATEIPEIKATNVAQQLGGAVTYSNRYLLMIAYDIVENALDFDDKDNSKQSHKPEQKTDDERPWLSEKQLASVIDRIRNNKPGEEFDTIEDFIEHLYSEFKMKKIYREQIDAELKSDFNKKLQ